MTEPSTTPKFSKRYSGASEAKAGGVTYTPVELADFVAKEIMAIAKPPHDRPIRILDPAVGHGELLHSLLAQVKGNIEVFGFEVDEAALKISSVRLSSTYPEASLNLVHGSFLDHVLDDFSDDLFRRGRKYDLIIANPPYVRTQVIGAERAQLIASQFGLGGRVDLYFAFLLGMGRVLSETGSVGIIVSNRFMTTRAGSTIRQYLQSDMVLKKVYDLGDTKMFDAAVLPAVVVANGNLTGERSEPALFTTIYETEKESTSRAINAIKALELSGVISLPDGRNFEVQHGTLHSDCTDPAGVWRLTSEGISGWLSTVERFSWAKFRDIGKVRVGVKTCADNVFIRTEWLEPSDLLRPLTTHKIARRYSPMSSGNGTKILYPHKTLKGRRVAVSLELHPVAAKYLEEHRKTLEGRKYIIEGGRKWYEIWVPQNPDDWTGPKLVFRDISEHPTFWLDLDDTIVNGDCYWLKPFPGMEEILWLALAVANSTFIEKFYDRKFNNKLYSGRRRFITQYVNEFPIPDPSTAISLDIIARTKLIFEDVASPLAVAAEKEINELVWLALTGSGPEDY